MVAPHIHPRATEILVNVAGPPLMTGVIPEAGAPGPLFRSSMFRDTTNGIFLTRSCYRIRWCRECHPPAHGFSTLCL
jgi:hypothetical protein